MKQEERNGFLLAGHWIVDINKRINNWPDPATLTFIDRIEETNGGAAFNLSCNLARLLPEAPLSGLGRVGDDGPGRWLQDRCRQAGIDTSGLKTTGGASTSFTDVMTERDTGRRTFFHNVGANALLAEKDFDFGTETSRIFFLGYLGMLEALDQVDTDGTNGASRVLKAASNQGLITCSDLVSAPNDHLSLQVAPCLPQLDVLFLNEWEAGRLLGRPLGGEVTITASQASDMAQEILSKGVRRTVVLHFSDGAVSAGQDGKFIIQGAVQMPPEEIVGTVGAGDAFAAGYMVGLHEGMDAQECIELAVCSAAVSLRAITCSDALVSWQECLTQGRSHGFRKL